MKNFNDIEVIINNKRYTLGGYESGEYLQKVASYINNKYNELSGEEAYKFLDSDLKNIMIQINIADDYFKSVKKIEEVEEANEIKDKEMFDLKHEILTFKTDEDLLLNEIRELKRELHKEQRKIVRLEAENHESKK